MSNETIMLAKGFSLPKVTYPAFITEKLDGVAVKIIGQGEGCLPIAITRQGEPSLAIGHILKQMGDSLEEGMALVGELYIPGKPFKYISGLSRRDTMQEELTLYVYDMYYMPNSVASYQIRRLNMQKFIHQINKPNVKAIGGMHEWLAVDENTLRLGIDSLLPNAKEGLVIRSGDELYTEGKRSWGMQKLKKQNTADLKVVGIEQAISKDGEPLGMLGRIIVNYKGKSVGVGPGKMIHADRKGVWKHPCYLVGKIIEVAYMPDHTYDAMREPRFIRYRPDKTEESYD